MDDPRWLDAREERAWRGYRRMRALLDLRLARDLAQDSGLSDADYDVLSNLSEVEGHRWRLQELASRLLWSKSRLSHQVTRMEQRGLVRREAHPADARGSVVVLTPAGWQMIRSAAPLHVTSVRRHFIDQLSPDQLDALGALTDTVIAHLSAPGTASDEPASGDRKLSSPPST